MHWPDDSDPEGDNPLARHKRAMSILLSFAIPLPYCQFLGRIRDDVGGPEDWF